MRNILYRGRNGLGNWFYGGYVYCKHSETHNIVTENTSRSFDWFDVIPKTVGQFTGLTDKNGVKIFEGDMVKYKMLDSEDYNSKTNTFTEKDFFGVVEYDEGGYGAGFIINNEKQSFYSYDGQNFNWNELEIIGNIHE